MAERKTKRGKIGGEERKGDDRGRTEVRTDRLGAGKRAIGSKRLRERRWKKEFNQTSL